MLRRGQRVEELPEAALVGSGVISVAVSVLALAALLAAGVGTHRVVRLAHEMLLAEDEANLHSKAPGRTGRKQFLYGSEL